MYYTEYEYANGTATNSTTNLISKITQKYGENELVNYGYDYNENGYVFAVYENGVKITQYAYGDMNQLSWCADKNTGLLSSIRADATRKQCKYAHTCSKRLLVPIPQTPEIVNEVDGCAFKER